MVRHAATTRVVKSPSKPTKSIKSITFQNSLARERERERERDRESDREREREREVYN